jgi:hypothetical protein
MDEHGPATAQREAVRAAARSGRAVYQLNIEADVTRSIVTTEIDGVDS